MATRKKGPRDLTAEHKAAMAEGRAQGRIVKLYLEALESNKPRRGRRRTTDSIKTRLDRIDQELAGQDALKRVLLIQERMDLERELAASGEATDITELEEGFIKAAKEYSGRKSISYAAWREAGVPPQVLSRAGITRSS